MKMTREESFVEHVEHNPRITCLKVLMLMMVWKPQKLVVGCEHFTRRTYMPRKNERKNVKQP